MAGGLQKQGGKVGSNTERAGGQAGGKRRQRGGGQGSETGGHSRRDRRETDGRRSSAPQKTAKTQLPHTAERGGRRREHGRGSGTAAPRNGRTGLAGCRGSEEKSAATQNGRTGWREATAERTRARGVTAGNTQERPAGKRRTAKQRAAKHGETQLPQTARFPPGRDRVWLGGGRSTRRHSCERGPCGGKRRPPRPPGASPSF